MYTAKMYDNNSSFLDYKRSRRLRKQESRLLDNTFIPYCLEKSEHHHDIKLCPLELRPSTKYSDLSVKFNRVKDRSQKARILDKSYQKNRNASKTKRVTVRKHGRGNVSPNDSILGGLQTVIDLCGLLHDTRKKGSDVSLKSSGSNADVSRANKYKEVCRLPYKRKYETMIIATSSKSNINDTTLNDTFRTADTSSILPENRTASLSTSNYRDASSKPEFRSAYSNQNETTYGSLNRSSLYKTAESNPTRIESERSYNRSMNTSLNRSTDRSLNPDPSGSVERSQNLDFSRSTDPSIVVSTTRSRENVVDTRSTNKSLDKNLSRSTERDLTMSKSRSVGQKSTDQSLEQDPYYTNRGVDQIVNRTENEDLDKNRTKNLTKNGDKSSSKNLKKSSSKDLEKKSSGSRRSSMSRRNSSKGDLKKESSTIAFDLPDETEGTCGKDECCGRSGSSIPCVRYPVENGDDICVKYTCKSVGSSLSAKCFPPVQIPPCDLSCKKCVAVGTKMSREKLASLEGVICECHPQGTGDGKNRIRNSTLFEPRPCAAGVVIPERKRKELKRSRTAVPPIVQPVIGICTGGCSDERVVDVNYAVVKITTFPKYRTYEIMKPSPEKPKKIPNCIEEIFVTTRGEE